jgi:Erv1 / Alr family
MNTFTENEYDSSDGMNVNFWGKILWSFLHTISFNYPVNPTEEDKNHYHEFLMALKHVIPCGACRENYAKNLKQIGYSRECLANRKSFSMFMYRLHNCVNKMLGKECSLTFNQVRDRYEMFRARCVNETPIIPKYKDKYVESKEDGCVEPLFGIKSKSVISVVPIKTKGDVFHIDPKCILKRISKPDTK